MKITLRIRLLLMAFIMVSVVPALSQPVNLRIDPYSATGGKVSDYFQQVDFIPLETTKESLFGRITRLEVTDSLFIVYDRIANALFLFFKDGKFHCKIAGGRVGVMGENTIPFFSVDRQRDEIVLNKIKNRKNYQLTYDFNGKLLKSGVVIYPADYYIFEGGARAYQFYDVRDENPDSTAYELFVAKKGKSVAQYFPYNAKASTLPNTDILWPGPASFYYSGDPSLVFYTRPYDYNIYSVTENTLDTAYHMIFPLSNSLPDDFRSSAKYRNQRLGFIKENTDRIFSLSAVYQIENQLWFSASTWDVHFPGHLMLDLASKELINVDRLTPDACCFYLPILSGGEDLSKEFLLACDGNSFYSSYSSIRLLSLKESALKKGAEFPAPLKSFFKTATRYNNPVIIRLTPKH